MKKKTDSLKEAQLLDTILLVLSVHEKPSIQFITLELRKCGYILTIPEVREKLSKIKDDGFIEEIKL